MILAMVVLFRTQNCRDVVTECLGLLATGLILSFDVDRNNPCPCDRGKKYKKCDGY